MPRYDRYSPGVIDLLKRVQARAARTPGGEMTPGLLLQEFLAGTSPLREAILHANALEVLPPAEVAADAPAAQTVTLSADLRRDLDEAEAATPATVTTWHIVSAVWPDLQPRLAEFVRRNDGQPLPDAIPLPPQESLPAEPAQACTPAPAAPTRPLLGGILETIGRELTAAEPTHPVVGRDRETNELIAILAKFLKPNAVLLGDAGVGKTAIVEGLAQRIRRGEVPDSLKDKRIVEVPMVALFGGPAQRLRDIIAQAESDPSLILFIDEVHLITAAGDLLKPALARGKLRLIGATTWPEYYESIERDQALKRRFHEIRVEEPSAAAVASILAGVVPSILAHHGMEAGPEIVPLVISLCRTELPSRRFPDKAIDVIDRACATASLVGVKRLEAVHVRSVIASLAGIAFTSDSVEFNERLATLEDRLKMRVLRQEDAIRAVSQVVRLCKRRLDMRSHRPDGVFLFVGKSGVGKTALATTLAETLLGSDQAVIRLDMTGFTQPHSVSTLLGSPPGYVDSDEEPEWLEQLKKTPSSVLLLDELEKAHPEVTKVFLRAFDEGKITDARGNEYSLANTTVIATSNAHVNAGGNRVGFHAAESDRRRAWLDGLQNYFAPEFLNRFDEIVPFEPLTVGDLGIILREKILPQADHMLLADFNVRLQMSDSAVRRLAELADSEHFGARELERVFRNEVLLPAIDMVHAARAATPAAPATAVMVDRDAAGRLVLTLQSATT